MKHILESKMKFKNSSEDGFTLIEMAMVMVIVGIIISIMMTVMPSLIKTSKIREARALLAKYDYALQGYAIANFSLPGAAPAVPTGQPHLGEAVPALSFGYLPYKTLGL